MGQGTHISTVGLCHCPDTETRGNFPHTLEEILQPRSHGRVVLSAMVIMCDCPCQDPTLKIHGTTLTTLGHVTLLPGSVMLVLQVAQPTEHNTRCW